MPVVRCPREGCPFAIEDVGEVLAAALISAHTTEHTHKSTPTHTHAYPRTCHTYLQSAHALNLMNHPKKGTNKGVGQGLGFKSAFFKVCLVLIFLNTIK